MARLLAARFLALCVSALLACATALTLLAGPAAAEQVAADPTAAEQAATDGTDPVPQAVPGDQVAPGDQAGAQQQGPTVRELLQACKTKTDVCKFHPSSPPTFFLGDRHRVSRVLHNCSPVLQSESVSWSDSVSSTNTVGVTITASAGFEEVFEASIAASYTYSWERSHTFTQTQNVNVPSHAQGWVSLAVPKAKVTGQYELHFGDKFYGHYIWYIDHYTETGPRNGAKGQAIVKTEHMTDKERKQICGS